MLLGCIADDLTGATDLALMLARNGLRTVQTIGVPAGKAPDADAVVVALKSRTNPAEEAVAWSLAAADRLLAAGARQLFFKYCSTFDSTEKGNIGPVAEALMRAHLANGDRAGLELAYKEHVAALAAADLGDPNDSIEELRADSM